MNERAEAVEMFPEAERVESVESVGSVEPVDAMDGSRVVLHPAWNINADAENLAILLHDYGPPEGLAEQAKALDLVREARRRLADVERMIESAVADSMTGKTEEVHEVGVLEKRGGKKRKSWDHEGVASRVVAEMRVDKETGEVRELSPQQVADALLEAAGVSYWKVGSLKELGIDPSEYCTEEEGRVSIQIIKGDA